MNTGDNWKTLLESWPRDLPRRGLLVTTFGEGIPFVEFLISPGIVLLDRDKPDTVGARKVLVAYDNIAALKITDVIDLEKFLAMGFHPPA